LQFAAFKLKPHANEWLTLLRANGGESARLLSQEQCGDAKLRMCCLLVPDRPARVKRLRTLPESEAFEDERPSTWELEEAMDRAGRWGAIYRRIAIVVPVVVKNGIGMAQGMRRLDMTSTEDAGRGLGMLLLAHVAYHFGLQYLFLSPVGPFWRHVKDMLNEREVPYGNLGYGSLIKALREPTAGHRDEKGITVDHVQDHQGFDVVHLFIEPGRFRKRKTYRLHQLHHASPRVLYLDPRRKLETAEYRRQNGQMRVDRGLDYYDFLWNMAGDGVLAIDGKCLAIAVLGLDL